jgi:hypothetical protein
MCGVPATALHYRLLKDVTILDQNILALPSQDVRQN